jgi:hypothetical protein
MNEDAVEKAFEELDRVRFETKEAVILIESLLMYICAYEGEFNPQDSTIKDRIIATRWLERNKK